jgi:hypothetical protein
MVLSYRMFLPEAGARAVVVAIHGLGESAASAATAAASRGVAEAAHAHLLDIQSRTAAERREIRRREWPNWSEAEILRSCAAQEDCDSRIVRNGNVIPTAPWPDLVQALTASEIPALVITGTVRTGITPEHRRIAESAGARVEVFDGAPGGSLRRRLALYSP